MNDLVTQGVSNPSTPSPTPPTVIRWSEGTFDINIDLDAREQSTAFELYDKQQSFVFQDAVKKVDGKNFFKTEKEFLRTEELEERILNLDIENNKYSSSVVEGLKKIYLDFSFNPIVVNDFDNRKTATLLTYESLCKISIYNSNGKREKRIIGRGQTLPHKKDGTSMPSPATITKTKIRLLRETVIQLILNISHLFCEEVSKDFRLSLKYDEEPELTLEGIIDLYVTCTQFELIRKLVSAKLTPSEASSINDETTMSELISKLEEIAAKEEFSEFISSVIPFSNSDKSQSEGSKTGGAAEKVDAALKNITTYLDATTKFDEKYDAASMIVMYRFAHISMVMKQIRSLVDMMPSMKTGDLSAIVAEQDALTFCAQQKHKHWGSDFMRSILMYRDELKREAAKYDSVQSQTTPETGDLQTKEAVASIDISFSKIKVPYKLNNSPDVEHINSLVSKVNSVRTKSGSSFILSVKEYSLLETHRTRKFAIEALKLLKEGSLLRPNISASEEKNQNTNEKGAGLFQECVPDIHTLNTVTEAHQSSVKAVREPKTSSLSGDQDDQLVPGDQGSLVTSKKWVSPFTLEETIYLYSLDPPPGDFEMNSRPSYYGKPNNMEKLQLENLMRQKNSILSSHGVIKNTPALFEVAIPRYFSEIRSPNFPFKQEWIDAEHVEFDYMCEEGILLDLTQEEINSGIKAQKANWHYTLREGYGFALGFNARLAVNRYAQFASEDYTDFFHHPQNVQILRTMLAAAAQKQMHIHVASFKGCSNLEVTYIDIEGDIKRLKDGLEKSSEQMYLELKEYLLSQEFQWVDKNCNIFFRGSGADRVNLVACHDEILFLSENLDALKEIKKTLIDALDGIDRGKPREFSGLNIDYDQKHGVLKLDASDSIALLRRKDRPMNADESSFCNNPMDIGWADKSDDNELNLFLSADARRSYASCVKTLQHIADTVRFDIWFALQRLKQFVDAPTHHHNNALNHLFGYICATRDVGITYGTGGELTAYADCSAHPQKKNFGVAGFVIMYAGAPIMWESQSITGYTGNSVNRIRCDLLALELCAKKLTFLHSFLSNNEFCNANSTTTLFNDNIQLIEKFRGLSSSFEEYKMSQTLHCGIQENNWKVCYVKAHDQLAQIINQSLGNHQFTGLLKRCNFR